LQRFRSWKQAHEQTIEAGSRAGVRVLTVRASAAQPPEDGEALPDVRVEVLARCGRGARPAGPRFGALVHAVLALTPLDADEGLVADLARQQARLLDASDAEHAAACALVTDAFAHPLLQRARTAATAGRLRREAPVAYIRPSGVLVEGVVDLAFEDEAGWTVVDFKTDADLGDQLDTYLRQVQLYAAAVAKATSRPASGVLLRI
jgi:ATP-dependent exoDNAse (exonuclease V) beta subunit